MLPLTSISLGHTVASLLTKPEILAMTEVRGCLEHCQSFLIEAAVQIKSRFPIGDPILSSLGFLDPLALSATQRTTVINVATKFPNILDATSLVTLEDEWRHLSFTHLSVTFNPKRDRIDQFWGGIDDVKFPTVCLFVKSLLALPHDVERVFSQVTLIPVIVCILFRTPICARVSAAPCMIVRHPATNQMIWTSASLLFFCKVL